MAARPPDPLERFHPAVRAWFETSFGEPTPAQRGAWPPIARGESTLVLAPTGSGKTLAAFLACLDRIAFGPAPAPKQRCRVVYISPLRALAVDVDRNLRAPLAGIANVAGRRGEAFFEPRVAIRTGDTPARERARFAREPADILITTPESLYLLLTSTARETLRSVETAIVDEIHALVPTKRGAHLALSLERLEALAGRRLQRIGLSATQRPLDEVARFLGGVEGGRIASERPREARSTEDALSEIRTEFEQAGDVVRHRPVTIVDAGSKKVLELRIEVPVEDMARLDEPVEIESGPAARGPVRPSIWTAIHPRLLDLVREHRSTLVFVNSRRLAERLAAALNDLAGETLVHAHHGSIAREQRLEIEDRLKTGRVRALVATSSLELGIDMGAIDLVVQIEAPATVASGLQRIGRGGHRVGEPSRGVIYPKYRGDLVACAALARAMREGEVEAVRYPRNPLDVLAQQIVAMVAMEPFEVGVLFDLVRRAAPFADLSESIFEGVLDMLSGRYASDDFAALRPRVVYDRVSGVLEAREGARRIAVLSGGTIPDRGLYGVFLAGGTRKEARVGELDEEMVFESHPGDTFVLGASTWRIEEITHDRVLVSPAPGEPGRMPFWRGDAAGRSLELGRRIGALVRELRSLPRGAAQSVLEREHCLDPLAADNLLRYLADQQAAAGAVPDDSTIVIERVRDELGDWRVCVLSPLGGRVHAPWAMAAVARVRDETGIDAETLWNDDGFVLRFPESDVPPDVARLIPAPDELESLVIRQLGATSLFAARFREIASRALLLPRRRPGRRSPLWQTRKRAQDLLAVASQFNSFPMLLEAYRECLREVFDLPALRQVLEAIAAHEIRVETVDSTTPSPFAAAILFGFVANYIYEGDAPLAERRAQALSIDPAQLRELLGEAELRELLDADALDSLERELQRLEPALHAASVDGVHDLLLRLGDVSQDEIRERSEAGVAQAALAGLVSARRAVEIGLRGERRYVAVEHASRYRDAIGVPLPAGIPDAFLAPVADPAGDLVLRHARSHGPFPLDDLVRRFDLPRERALGILRRLTAEGRLVEGAFRPGGIHREWCDPEILQRLRRRSLARVRREVEPVEPATLARFACTWHGVTSRGRGLDAVLDAVERLQGAALPASLLESEILPARVEGYRPADLDELLAAGEIVWCGIEPLAERDGRIALYLSDAYARLGADRPEAHDLPQREMRLVEALRERGASFFATLHEAAGGGFPRETSDALWRLVWRGIVTNDGLRALRAWLARRPARAQRRRREGATRNFRSRRIAPPAAEGRWSLVGERAPAGPSTTERMAALAQQLLARHGLVTREVAASEAVAGGFRPVFDVLQALEAAGRIRRGYFVAGVGATQFASPAALDLLRRLRHRGETPEVATLAAADPANVWGSTLRWPAADAGAPARRPSRAVGAHVVLVDGALAAWIGRGARQAFYFPADDESEDARRGAAVARAIAALARRDGGGRLLAEIDGAPARLHPLALHLVDAGFVAGPQGFHLGPGSPVEAAHARPDA
ncbi:DEAD-box ATP-dependent RNA helicase CshC [Myxococcaceae bacterium]|nr:DEAD-box ATP-dependent RNA helicase CshC [Myxococcaceae bacterium]